MYITYVRAEKLNRTFLQTSVYNSFEFKNNIKEYTSSTFIKSTFKQFDVLIISLADLFASQELTR